MTAKEARALRCPSRPGLSCGDSSRASRGAASCVYLSVVCLLTDWAFLICWGDSWWQNPMPVSFAGRGDSLMLTPGKLRQSGPVSRSTHGLAWCTFWKLRIE